MKIDFYVLHMFVHKQNTIKIIKHLIDNPWVALNLLLYACVCAKIYFKLVQNYFLQFLFEHINFLLSFQIKMSPFVVFYLLIYSISAILFREYLKAIIYIGHMLTCL